MKKQAVLITLFMMACGSGTGTNSTYQSNQTNIKETPGSQFTIAMPLGASANQNVSCNISKECSNQVAQLVDITMENNEMHFNFETIGAGQTTVGIQCTGSTTENHTYKIVVE